MRSQNYRSQPPPTDSTDEPLCLEEQDDDLWEANRDDNENGRRPEVAFTEFRLKQGLIELLDLITSLGDGEIQSIEVRYGLPCALEIHRKHDAFVDQTGGTR